METAITTTLANDKALGEIFVTSGFFKDTKDQSQAIVKILAGREIGLKPIEAMTGIFIVQGKVTLGANLMAAAIKKSGKYNYVVTKHDDKECAIEFSENGKPIGTSTFTIDDAKKAGVYKSGGSWAMYPRNMLFARAMSNGVKWYCPDVFGYSPMYVPEEMGADVDEEGDPIDITPQPSPIVEHAKKIQDEDDESNVIPNNPLPYTKKSQHYDPATNDNPHLLYPGIELAETPYATLESIMAKAMKDGNGKEVQGIINQIYPEFYLQDIMVEDIPDAKVIEIVERLTGVRMEAN